MNRRLAAGALVVLITHFFGALSPLYADLNAGLVAYYPFEGNANDASGNRNNGTPDGGVTFVQGRSGLAAQFAGGGFVDCGNGPAFQFHDSDLTLCAWVYNDGNSGESVILSKEKSGVPQHQFRLATQGGDTVCFIMCDDGYLWYPFGLWDPSGGYHLQTSLPVSQWSHVVVTRSGLTFKLFVNGSQKSECTIQVNFDHSNNYNLMIGARYGPGAGYDFFYRGKIDDVRIYNRALSAAEVQALYNVGPGQPALSNIRASQRAGTNLVDVWYDLSSATAPVYVSVSISTNSGVSYPLQPAHLTGDGVTAPIGSGTLRHLVWGAGADLGVGYFPNTVIQVAVQPYCQSASGPFAVDLRGLTGGLTVSGRVRDAFLRQALSGASVSLAGQNTTTLFDGSYSLTNISLASGNTLMVSKVGYATHTGGLACQPGSTLATQPDIFLPPTPTNVQPVVTSVSARYKGIFLWSVNMNNDFTASVDWNGLAPGTVRFFANDLLMAETNGSGPTYSCTIDMAKEPFQPSLDPNRNKIRVNAVSGGIGSDPSELPVTIVPVPDVIKWLMLLRTWTPYVDGEQFSLGMELDFPDPPMKGVDVNLGPLGRFGTELQMKGEFSYTPVNGEWEFAFGETLGLVRNKPGRRSTIPGLARYSKLHLYLGNKTLEGSLRAGARGTLGLTDFNLVDAEAFGGGSIGGKLELTRYGVLDVIPGLSTLISWFPPLEPVVKGTSVMIWAKPELSAEFKLGFYPTLQFKPAEFGGKLGIEAEYEPNLGGLAKLRLYAGGEPSFKLQTVDPFLKELRFRAYAGGEIECWVFKAGPVEYVFVDVTWPSEQGAPAWPASLFDAKLARVVSEGAGPTGWQPLNRAYLKAGPEKFVADEPHARLATKLGELSLANFRQLSQTPVKGSVMAASPAKAASGKPAYSPEFGEPDSGTNQADLTLVQNAFPGSSPAMAARGTELMLLYVTDNGITNNLQYTDIAWTRWDGTNWSLPLAIRTNTQAEFAPQVAYDGNGDAIAVWERVADPDFNQTNLMAMAAQMEIVWSRWNRADGAWTEPVSLTGNGYLDHAPLLCGPLSDGSVLAVWTENQQNLLMGTNGPGNDTVLWAEWSAASLTWGAPQVLVDGLAYRLSQSLAGVGNHAVYAWTRDMDGVLTNDADQEVFFMDYTNNTWGTPRQLTTNTVADKTVRAAVAMNGSVFLVWQNGTNLVLSQNFSTNVSTARTDSQTAGFADYAMTVGPLGHLVLLWQEMSTNGSDAHYVVYDPVAATWGLDDLLCHDSPLERSFAPVWDAVGNLTVAYDKVQILYTNKTVTVEGGGSVTITNVPQPGQVDLMVTKRALVKDLALLAGDFTVQGVNYLPGDPLTLSATVHNSGNVAMSNVVVGFYDGNPDAGGVLLTNVTLAGWLAAAGTNVASAVWVVAEPATNHTLCAAANRAGLAGEFNGSNNFACVSIGGTDLAVSLSSYSAETNGAMRVIAQVQNLGAPSATNSVLAIRRYGSPNTPLMTVAVPLLEPGRLAQVALDLPAGTQPAGEQIYTLTADETRITSDIDTNNNTSSFAANLWIDSDGDGTSDSWMMQYFSHATGQAGDLSRAQDDADGDGVSNLAEYLAGTSPKDPHSYLSITDIGLGGTNGVQITWGSASNRLYSLQRAIALSGGLGFTNIAQHILSTPPENVYLDAPATNSPSLFYRVRVE